MVHRTYTACSLLHLLVFFFYLLISCYFFSGIKGITFAGPPCREKKKFTNQRPITIIIKASTKKRGSIEKTIDTVLTGEKEKKMRILHFLTGGCFVKSRDIYSLKKKKRNPLQERYIYLFLREANSCRSISTSSSALSTLEIFFLSYTST